MRKQPHPVVGVLAVALALLLLWIVAAFVYTGATR